MEIMVTYCFLYTQHLAQGRALSRLTKNTCGVNRFSMECLLNEGLGAMWTMLWDSSRGSSWVCGSRESLPLQRGTPHKWSVRKNTILTAKNPTGQFTKEIQTAMNYDKRCSTLLIIRKVQIISYMVDENTHWKSL